MGTGCGSVVRRTTDDGLIEVEGLWAGGRTGMPVDETLFPVRPLQLPDPQASKKRQ